MQNNIAARPPAASAEAWSPLAGEPVEPGEPASDLSAPLSAAPHSPATSMSRMPPGTAEPVIPPQFDGASPAQPDPASSDAAANAQAGQAEHGQDDASPAGAHGAANIFTSRRDILGQPRATVVPTISDGIRTQQESSAVSAPRWYKLGAGACLVLALGFIGFRQNQKSRHEVTDYAASWLPPRESRMAAGWLSDDMERLGQARGGRISRELDYPGLSASQNFDDDLISRSVRRRPDGSARPASSGGRIMGRAGNISDERHEPGFHDEIERRVRRMAAEKNESAVEDAAENSGRRRKRSLKDDEYDKISEMAAEGMSEREISRTLSIPVGEVNAVIGVRSRRATSTSAMGATGKSRGFDFTVGDTMNVPLEIQ